MVERSIPAGQVAVALGTAALGAVFFIGSFWLPGAGGYAHVGPAWMPRVVGFGLIVLGALLLREALTGGFRHFEEDAERALKSNWRAFAWVSGGVIAYGVLIGFAGFILASAVLFAVVARGFGSARWLSNAGIGLIVAATLFALFNYGLSFPLPKGFLAPLLP
jgi:putative tricarboxylic transport membrane protein